MKGSYGLMDADGRVRVVNYVANGYGFRAAVATNEPGTVPSTPAGVNVVPPEASVAVKGETLLKNSSTQGSRYSRKQ